MRRISSALRSRGKLEQPMSEDLFGQSRFLVRQGSKGWMVYDRERKGPALVGTNPAANLTKEEAERIWRLLAASGPRAGSHYSLR